MSKLENNKKMKKDALLNTAFDLFTSKGIQKTSISDIVNKAGVAKGTFYLYFSDKYDIKNKLITHKASQLFLNAYHALQQTDITDFEDQVIFLADFIIDRLTENKSLLTFISKQLNWGIFKNGVFSLSEEKDNSAYYIYEEILARSGIVFEEPEIMIYMIMELVSGCIYNSILYEQPMPIDQLKPYIFRSARDIIHAHTITHTDAPVDMNTHLLFH